MNTYIDNCTDYKNTIINNFSHAQCIENFFTAEQVSALINYQFQNTERVKWTDTSSNIQPIVDIDTMFDNLPWLDTLFSKVLGDYAKYHTGNFYITTRLHDCHVDLVTAEESNTFEWGNNVLPYKSVVIPLLAGVYAPTYTCFFKQRHIGHSITLDRDFYSEQKDSMYELARNLRSYYYADGTVSNHDRALESDDYIFPHVGNKTLSGLEIENVFQFTPGNLFLFDACQVHASCASVDAPNARFMKSGINIQFYKEI